MIAQVAQVDFKRSLATREEDDGLRYLQHFVISGEPSEYEAAEALNLLDKVGVRSMPHHIIESTIALILNSGQTTDEDKEKALRIFTPNLTICLFQTDMQEVFKDLFDASKSSFMLKALKDIRKISPNTFEEIKDAILEDLLDSAVWNNKTNIFSETEGDGDKTRNIKSSISKKINYIKRKDRLMALIVSPDSGEFAPLINRVETLFDNEKPEKEIIKNYLWLEALRVESEKNTNVFDVAVNCERFDKDFLKVVRTKILNFPDDINPTPVMINPVLVQQLLFQ